MHIYNFFYFITNIHNQRRLAKRRDRIWKNVDRIWKKNFSTVWDH